MTHQYSSFKRRVAAWIIDCIILTVPFLGIKDTQTSFLLTILASTAYFTWTVSTYGAGIGKMVMKMRIIKEDGSKVGVNDALLRELSSYLSLAVLFLGCLNIIWDPKKQSWHDKIAKTIVVNTDISSAKKDSDSAYLVLAFIVAIAIFFLMLIGMTLAKLSST